MPTRSKNSRSEMQKNKPSQIEPAKGKLGVMLPGMGAVATTFVAGVEAVRKGLAKPIGSLTQMGTIRLGQRTDQNSPLIKKFVPLADLKDLVFTGWDIFEDDMYTAATKAGVVSSEDSTSTRCPGASWRSSRWGSRATNETTWLDSADQRIRARARATDETPGRTSTASGPNHS